jgi:hypothetical protein
VEVLFETVDEDGYRKGWTGSYARIAVAPDLARENEIASVRVERVDRGFCVASTRREVGPAPAAIRDRDRGAVQR